MLRALHDHTEFSEKFIALLVARNIDLEEDLCDQLLNTHFMNRFRKVGLIDYNGHLTVRTELFTDLVLHD